MKNRSFLSLFLAIGIFVSMPFIKAMEQKESISEPFWSETPTHFLFAPGILNSEYIIVKYCSEYNASTGEHIVSNNALDLINGINASACNFAEIVLTHAQSYLKPNFFKSHLYNLVKHFEDRRFKPYNISILGDPINGLTLKPYLINPRKFNIGQELDIQILSDHYDACCQKNGDKDKVLYGSSRGAATSFNFIATEYGKKTDKSIKAVILEGCFDAVRNISFFDPFLRVLTQYKKHGIAPIDVVKEFVATCNAHNISVLFVTSLVDEIVPYTSTMRLCKEVYNAGLRNFYLLELEHSGHRYYTCQDADDMQRYQRVVHAFYKMNNLSHNPLLAQAGEEDLKKCLFTAETLQKTSANL